MKLWDVKREENFASLLQISAGIPLQLLNYFLSALFLVINLQEFFRQVWKTLQVGASSPFFPSH